MDDIAYRQWGRLYVGDTLLEHVPCLAICINLGADNSAMLFHCDSDWNVRGAILSATVDEGKDRAEKNYPGVASRWIDTNTSAEAALEYFDAQPHCAKCSFCGKRPFEY
ncbi:hypothetical protein [Pseudoduganella violaceinigra]|uniref:hypothetical protein n=1 Tax=Pseudoduganella violaceinigra TaxID=246602 RepID=UPI0012B65C1E|nr:hypothetical protein [Pseudoduganella violaceinigra]